jgi:acetylornithine deacetylase/succinyl-diaminopimelate desuccinylase-like protein
MMTANCLGRGGDQPLDGSNPAATCDCYGLISVCGKLASSPVVVKQAKIVEFMKAYSRLFFFSLVTSCSWALNGQETHVPRDSVELLQRYLRVDSTNPPGNESRAVDFLAAVLEDAGLPYETAERMRGRGNLWARIEGGSEPALILLNHTDVVPAVEEAWSMGAFSGEVREGYLYGRGALDMKSTAIMQLLAFVKLHQAGKPLNRDVIFMATADEESGGAFGAGWLVQHKPELFEGAGYVLTEGGSGNLIGEQPVFLVELNQKIPVWVRLVTKGQPGHGSAPGVTSAVDRLTRAVRRIQEYRFPPQITPDVDQYFRALSPYAPRPWRAPFANMRRAVRDERFLRQLQVEDRYSHALTRVTVSVTRLAASDKINVIPGSASAELDCRLLPGQDVDVFLAILRNVIDDPAVAVEVLMRGEPSRPTKVTPMYRAIETVMQRHFAGAPVIPAVATGFTDSRFLRPLGIACYGFTPVILPAKELSSVHGNDERISIRNIQRGTQLMYEIVEEFVY